MNEIMKTDGGKLTMGLLEISDFLGVDLSTVQKRVKEMFPAMVRNGVPTRLFEEQVTELKKALGSNGHLGPLSDLQNIHTDLEIAEMTLQVIAYHKAAADDLRAKLAEAAPKLEAHAALMVSERTLSITDASKHFGFHPRREVFPYLRAAGYLTKKDLPTQDAIDAGYLVVRELQGYDDEVRPVARVLVSQLDTWRLRVVPQVKAWMEKP
jgi:phage antirepressor YoqD-like protein